MKKKTCRVYGLTKKEQGYSKRLKNKGCTLYDRKGNILERMQFEYFSNTYRKTRSPRKGVWQIPGYLKEPIITKQTYHYDNGKLVAELLFKPPKKLQTKVIYEYDSEGREIYSKHFEVNGDLIWENFYKYDVQGRKVEWLSNHYTIEDISKWYYYYDRDGRNTATDLDSTLTGPLRYEYRYDKMGNFIEESCYSKAGTLDNRSLHTYDQGGHKIKFEYQYDENASGCYIVYERDERGNIIRSKHYAPHLVTLDESEYNEYGHVIRTIYTNYFCDCRGVRVEPYQLDELDYEYY